ncbi:MAG: guanylate kinase [Armatimonadota bacterium]
MDEYLKKQKQGRIIVFSGPSGVGKDTLLVRLEEACPSIRRCVTYTTRQPRPAETPGIDYNFVSVEEFRRMIEAGEFLEYAKVHLDMYGTPLAEAMRIRDEGFDAVLKIDVQGGLAVKEQLPEAVMIFIGPPSLEELERRLRARYTDSEEAITKRLADARHEIECIPKYDYLVINDHIDTAVRRLCCIIEAEHSKI